MRRFLGVLVLVALIVVGSVMAQEGEPLKIGLMVDQSGPFTIYGYELEQGFKLGLLYAAGVNPSDYDSIEAALADVAIAGRPVEVVVRDNASNADTAASQARELIEQEGVEILVGAPSSGVMTGVQQIALDSDVTLFVTPAASYTITGPNFNVNTFRVCRNTFQDFLAFAPYANTELGNKFVILAIDTDFGRGSAAAAGVLASAGIEFIGDPIYVPADTTNFTPYLQQVIDSGADAVLPIWAGDSSVTLFQQIAELGVPDQMAVVSAFNSNDIVKALSDPSMIGNISWIVYHYSFPQNEINDWLVEQHKAVYNDVPDLFTECSFATAQALVQSVEATGGDTLPEMMIPVLEGMIFEGPKGTYGIRPSDHQALVPMYIARLANLDDPDQNYYELLAEVPASQIIPPVLLPEALQERTAADEEFMTAFAEAAGGAEGEMEATEEATPES